MQKTDKVLVELYFEQPQIKKSLENVNLLQLIKDLRSKYSLVLHGTYSTSYLCSNNIKDDSVSPVELEMTILGSDENVANSIRDLIEIVGVPRTPSITSIYLGDNREGKKLLRKVIGEYESKKT